MSAAAPTIPLMLATTNIVVNANSAAPAASPSSPSMRLNALVMPTNQMTVNSRPIRGPSDTMPASGSESVVMRTPAA